MTVNSEALAAGRISVQQKHEMHLQAICHDDCNSPLGSLVNFSLDDLQISCPSTLPCKQMYGNWWGFLWQTCPKYRSRLISSFWTTSSWMFSQALMSMFRLRSILVTPAILLKQSTPNTISVLCVSAVTIHVSAIYISILSTRFVFSDFSCCYVFFCPYRLAFWLHQQPAQFFFVCHSPLTNSHLS